MTSQNRSPAAGAGGRRRRVGRALVHQHRRALRQRAVHDVGVTGDPADVGRAPEHVLVAQVEHQLGGVGGADQVAAGGVQDALGLAGGAAGVQREQRVLGVVRRRLVARAGAVDGVVPPHVAALGPAHRVAGPLDHQHALDLGVLEHRPVGRVLERHDVATPPATVGGDEQAGAGVAQAIGQGLGREAAEHHGVRGADAGTRQHGDGRLRHHRQVDGDEVAGLDAERGQRVGRLAHLAVQLLVGQDPGVARLALPQDGGLVAPPPGQVAIDAVGADVERAADEPAGVWELPVKGLGPRPGPGQLGGDVGPEALGGLDRARPEALVLVEALDVRLPCELGRRRELAALFEDARDVLVAGVVLVVCHVSFSPFSRAPSGDHALEPLPSVVVACPASVQPRKPPAIEVTFAYPILASDSAASAER
jgi:hypothetical protein